VIPYQPRSAKSLRQVGPPGRSAKSLRQVAPPTRSANSLRQATPPSHSAKSLRQVTPPSHSAKSLRQVTPPGRSARSVRQVGPPGRSARSVRQVTPPSRSPPGGGWRKAGRGVAWSLAKTRQNCGRIRGSVTEQERLSPKRACRARSTSPGRRPGFRPPDRAGPVGAVHRGRAESAGSRHSARTNPVPAFHQHSGRGKGWKPFPPLQRPTSSVIPHQTHSARSLRQATPPSRSAKPLRQATPPSHSAKTLRQVRVSETGAWGSGFVWD
jgi:hypothetical protein